MVLRYAVRYFFTTDAEITKIGNNVKEEKNQNKTKDINMTLTSVASYNNDLTT